MKELEKRTKPQVSRKRIIIKITAEINEIGTKRTIEKTMKPRADSLKT